MWCHQRRLGYPCHWGSVHRTSNLWKRENITDTYLQVTYKTVKILDWLMYFYTRVSIQFFHRLDHGCLQVVDSAHVVEPTAGHKVSRRSVCTGHHPWGLEGNRIDLQKEENHRTFPWKMFWFRVKGSVILHYPKTFKMYSNIGYLKMAKLFFLKIRTEE